MKNLLLTTAMAFAMITPVYAAGTHEADHGHEKAEAGHGHAEMAAGTHEAGHGDEKAEAGHAHAEMAAGMPGKADDVSRTIDVTMRETDDGKMIFEPASFAFEQGETIRFNVTNMGEIEHEFVIDDVAGNAKHKEMMAAMDMGHDDPNSVRLDEGKSGEVIWTFSKVGTFEFACLIPGHYESGMHGPITVSETQASAETVAEPVKGNLTVTQLK